MIKSCLKACSLALSRDNGLRRIFIAGGITISLIWGGLLWHAFDEMAKKLAQTQGDAYYQTPADQINAIRGMTHPQSGHYQLISLVIHGDEKIVQEIRNTLLVYISFALGISVLVTFLCVQFFRVYVRSEEALEHESALRASLEAKSRLLQERNTELSRLQQFSDETLRSLPGMFYVVDAKGCLQRWNQQIEHVTGLSHEALQGINVQRFFPDALQHAVQQAIEATMVNGESTLSAGFRVRDGQIRPYEFHSIRTTIGGERVLLGMGIDVTERKAAELALLEYQNELEVLVDERTISLIIAKDAAEASNRAKDAFLAKVSHELKTPLHGMLGMLSLAKRQATDEKMATYLKKSHEAGEHLFQLVNQVLDFTYLKGKLLVIEKKPVALEKIFAPLRDVLARGTSQKQLSMVFDVPETVLACQAVCDPGRLGHAISNLIRNAIAYTERGQVSLSARLDHSADGKAILRCTVSDTGCGISPDDQARILLPFEQADNSRTRTHGGLGIGLALSKQLVEAMGGTLQLESQVDAGSTFCFSVELELAGEDGVMQPKESPSVSLVPG